MGILTCSSRFIFVVSVCIGLLFNVFPSSTFADEVTSTVQIITENTTPPSSTSDTSGSGSTSGSDYPLFDVTSVGSVVSLSEGDFIKFKVANSPHTLKLIQYDSEQGEIEIEIRSTPIILFLVIGISQSVDLTGDNVFDLTVTFDRYVGSRAYVSIGEYVAEPSSQSLKPLPAEPSSSGLVSSFQEVPVQLSNLSSNDSQVSPLDVEPPPQVPAQDHSSITDTFLQKKTLFLFSTPTILLMSLLSLFVVGFVCFVSFHSMRKL